MDVCVVYPGIHKCLSMLSLINIMNVQRSNSHLLSEKYSHLLRTVRLVTAGRKPSSHLVSQRNRAEIRGSQGTAKTIVSPPKFAPAAAFVLSLYSSTLDSGSTYFLWFCLSFLSIIWCNCTQNTLFCLQLNPMLWFAMALTYIGLSICLLWADVRRSGNLVKS